MAGHVRVVTLNLWGDRAPLDARLDAAADGLRSLHPDVVLLQEVRVGEGLANTAEQLAARLTGLGVTYRAATTGDAGTWGPGSARGEEGLAVLARHPVLDVRELELPEARPKERRILLSARIDVPGAGAVWFHTTHLHWRLSDGAARERQVLAIDDAVRALGWNDVHILGGDFNAAPDCDEIRFLCGRHSLSQRRTYWLDCFGRARAHDQGWTWASRNPSTGWLRWLELDRRIDYIFSNGERPDGRGAVLDARVVLDAPVAGVWPSDHFAVMADVVV